MAHFPPACCTTVSHWALVRPPKKACSPCSLQLACSICPNLHARESIVSMLTFKNGNKNELLHLHLHPHLRSISVCIWSHPGIVIERAMKHSTREAYGVRRTGHLSEDERLRFFLVAIGGSVGIVCHDHDHVVSVAAGCSTVMEFE